MAATRPVTTCDQCKKVRDEPEMIISWYTGWWVLKTQYPGEWEPPRYDFCSDKCLGDWAKTRGERK